MIYYDVKFYIKKVPGSDKFVGGFKGMRSVMNDADAIVGKYWMFDSVEEAISYLCDLGLCKEDEIEIEK